MTYQNMINRQFTPMQNQLLAWESLKLYIFQFSLTKRETEWCVTRRAEVKSKYILTAEHHSALGEGPEKKSQRGGFP